VKKLFPVFLIFLGGCATSAGKPELYFEPSLERAMEIVGQTREGRGLLSYLDKNPVSVKYSDSISGPWPKFNPAEKEILIPENVRRSDVLAGLLIARGLAEYRVYDSLNLSETLAETEEIAAVTQAHIALELGLEQGALLGSAAGKAALSEVCVYVAQGPEKFSGKILAESLSPNAEYQRPLETIDGAKKWLGRVKDAMAEGTLPQLLYERDMERVKKKTLTQARADANSARVRSADPESLWRMQRQFFASAGKTLDEAAALGQKTLEEDLMWRRRNSALISQRLAELTWCRVSPR